MKDQQAIDAKNRADAIHRRRTARAFDNLRDAAENQKPDPRGGHPSREPDRNPWEKPDSLDRQ